MARKVYPEPLPARYWAGSWDTRQDAKKQRRRLRAAGRNEPCIDHDSTRRVSHEQVLNGCRPIAFVSRRLPGQRCTDKIEQIGINERFDDDPGRCNFPDPFEHAF